MKLEELKKIAEYRRNRQSNRHFEDFVVMISDHIDELLAVAESAYEIRSLMNALPSMTAKAEFVGRDALAELQKRYDAHGALFVRLKALEEK